MSLYQKLITLYPELSSYDFAYGAIRIQNDSDGKGDYIREWNHPTLTRPTQAQLDSLEE
jgi:hypothetical protein